METKTWSKTHQGAEPSWGIPPPWGMLSYSCSIPIAPRGIPLGKERTTHSANACYVPSYTCFGNPYA